MSNNDDKLQIVSKNKGQPPLTNIACTARKRIGIIYMAINIRPTQKCLHPLHVKHSGSIEVNNMINRILSWTNEYNGNI